MLEPLASGQRSILPQLCPEAQGRQTTVDIGRFWIDQLYLGYEWIPLAPIVQTSLKYLLMEVRREFLGLIGSVMQEIGGHPALPTRPTGWICQYSLILNRKHRSLPEGREDTHIVILLAIRTPSAKSYCRREPWLPLLWLVHGAVATPSHIGEMVHFLVRAFCIRMVGKTMPGFCQGDFEMSDYGMTHFRFMPKFRHHTNQHLRSLSPFFTLVS